MLRNIGAVVAGYAAWTVVFLGSAQLIRMVMPEVHDESGLTSDVTALSMYLVMSVIASLLAGYLAAKIATPPKARWVWITAVLLLATGVPVQLSTWDQLPLWYNLIFLGLLVPATVFGGVFGGSGEETPTSP